MTAARPLIGLTTYREHARWGVWDTSADLLPTVYARAVEEVGGVPVLLPPTAVPGAAEAIIARLDGLVVSGGADVDPAAYGARAHASVSVVRPDRDAWELALVEAARTMPVLGVCRGMQVMAVAAGGALEQHLPDALGHAGHGPAPGVFGDVGVEVEPGTLLHGLVGDRLQVHCHHHQAVASAPGWAFVARAEDGTVEAMEQHGGPFRVAVQWHPEMAADVGLFAGLVRAARG